MSVYQAILAEEAAANELRRGPFSRSESFEAHSYHAAGEEGGEGVVIMRAGVVAWDGGQLWFSRAFDGLAALRAWSTEAFVAEEVRRLFTELRSSPRYPHPGGCISPRRSAAMLARDS
jgi:hypothetical protein